MTTTDERESVRIALHSWGRRRRALEAERDALVLRALKAGIIKEAIHQATGLGRNTIDRIEKGKEPPL